MPSVSLTDCLLLFITACEIGLFIYKPRTGLIAFFLSKFTIDLFWQDRLLGYGINILQIHGILFFIASLYLFFVHRHSIRAQRKQYGLLSALIISNLIASLWGCLNSHFMFFDLVASPLTPRHIAEWNLRFLNLAGAFVLVPFVFTQKDELPLLAKLFTLATFIPVISGIEEYIRKISVSELVGATNYSVNHFPRLTAGYHDATVYGIVLLTGLCGSLFLFYQERNRGNLRWLYLAYFFITLFLLFHTYSRTLWLTTLCILILFFAYQKKYSPLLLTILMSLIAIYTVPTIAKRFRQEISYIKQDNKEYLTIDMTGTGRIGLWKIAADHYYRLDPVSKIIGSGGAYGSHNQFIAFLLKNGFIGIIFLILFLYDVFKKLNHNRRMDISHQYLVHYSLVLSLLISSVFIANQFMQLWDHVSFNYFFWGMAGILIQPIEKEDQSIK